MILESRVAHLSGFALVWVADGFHPTKVLHWVGARVNTSHLHWFSRVFGWRVLSIFKKTGTVVYWFLRMSWLAVIFHFSWKTLAVAVRRIDEQWSSILLISFARAANGVTRVTICHNYIQLWYSLDLIRGILWFEIYPHIQKNTRPKPGYEWVWVYTQSKKDGYQVDG